MIITTLLMLVLPASAVQRYQAGDSLIVLSKSGLNIREKADVKAMVLVLAPCGALVTMEEGTAGAAQTIEGIRGAWTRVTYRGITGYAFDGFLGRLRAPEEGCESLEEYFSGEFRPTGSPVEKDNSGEGTEEKITELSFSNGATIRHKDISFLTPDPSFTMSTYTLPGITRVEEVFLVLKLLGYIEPGFTFPAQSGRAGVTKKGLVVTAEIYHKGADVVTLELTYRKPNAPVKKPIDDTAHRIVISRKDNGIDIDMYNMKR
jgi:hypothetical protein